MVSPDFTFFNLMNRDRKGLVYQKAILDRLAPMFFLPRIQRCIELSCLGFKGYNVMLPMGAGNLNDLQPENQERLMHRSVQLSMDLNLKTMAVDRSLKGKFTEEPQEFKLLFGDRFIQALAVVWTAGIVSRQAVNRIVLVGETQDFMAFTDFMTEFGVPVCIQALHPSRYEVMAHELLYQKGSVVSVGALNPLRWETGDLIIGFDYNVVDMISYSQKITAMAFCDYSTGLAPELEENLEYFGLPGRLNNLAPMVESYLLSSSGAAEATFAELVAQGQELGLWELFLDKVP